MVLGFSRKAGGGEGASVEVYEARISESSNPKLWKVKLVKGYRFVVKGSGRYQISEFRVHKGDQLENYMNGESVAKLPRHYMRGRVSKISPSEFPLKSAKNNNDNMDLDDLMSSANEKIN